MNNIVETLALELNNNSEFKNLGDKIVVWEYASKYDDFKFFIKQSPDDFLCTPKELVAFIRVYRAFSIKELAKNIKTLSKIKAKLSRLAEKEIFMGACVGDIHLELDIEPILGNVESELRKFYSKDFLTRKNMLDSMVFGEKYLMRYWDKMEDLRECPTYSFYKFSDNFHAESYFQGNAKEHILIVAKRKSIDETLEKGYYPLPTGKEAYNLADLTIKLEDVHYSRDM